MQPMVFPRGFGKSYWSLFFETCNVLDALGRGQTVTVMSLREDTRNRFLNNARKTWGIKFKATRPKRNGSTYQFTITGVTRG